MSRAPTEVERILEHARRSQRAWAARDVARRLEVVRAFRRTLAAFARDIAEDVAGGRRASLAETLTAEVLPLLDACRFLERRAEKLLRPRRPGLRDRPWWLVGTRSEVRREPYGVVLVIGPANYPLMLPGIQTLQALVAGNAVVWKPAPGGEPVARTAKRFLEAAGLPDGLLTVTDASVETATAALDAGPDKVVLTGALDTGRAALRRLAEQVVPATVELSGCDAAFVLDDADIDLVERAIAFGLRLNGGATCIGPRRIFVDRRRAGVLEDRLAARLREAAPLPVDPETRARLRELVEAATAAGARLVTGGMVAGAPLTPVLLANVTATMAVAQADLFAPVVSILPVDDEREALREAARCPFALGATVFGSPRRAEAFAARVDAGAVVVNDMIVPTADPRLPFGGRGLSGFGVTRGAEGLLELTRPKSVVVRRGRFRPHFDPLPADLTAWLLALLRLVHGSWRDRAALVRELITGHAPLRPTARRPQVGPLPRV